MRKKCISVNPPPGLKLRRITPVLQQGDRLSGLDLRCRRTYRFSSHFRERRDIFGFSQGDILCLELTPYIWFDGRLIPSEEAKIHVLTHALHYGTSYFEGIRAYACSDGTSAVFRLKEHMKRFVNSGKILRLTCPYDLATMEKAVIDTMVANKMSAGYIRPLAWVGEGPLGVFPGNPVHVIVATWPWGAYLGAEALEMGVRVKTSSFNRIHPNTLMGKAKAGGNYVNSVLAKMEAQQRTQDHSRRFHS